MAVGNTVRIIITGDAKDALQAFGQVDVAAGGMGTKLASVGKVAAVAGVAVAAGVAAAGVALFKIGETFDEQYDKIRTATGATGVALDNLKDDFKAVVSEVPASFEDAGTAIAKFSQNLGDSGKGVQVLSEQMLELSRITKTDLGGNVDASVAVIKNWNLEGEDMTNVMDLIFRASQASGIAFSDLSTKLAENGVVFRGLGFNVEQATTVIAGLGKAGVDVADVMPALTKTLASAAKAGKDATTVYQETLRAIKDAPDAWTASAKAIEVFGAKAGPKFAELIREGKFAFDDLGESIAEGTETIIGAGKDTQDFGEKWQLIKNRVFVALEPLAMKVFDGVGKAMDKLGPYVEKVGVWFDENLPKAIAAVKPWVDKLVAAFVIFGGILANQVFPAVQKVFTFLQEHDELLKGLAIVVGGVLVAAFVAWAISAGAAAVATIAAALPVIALIAGLALLVAGIIWVVENFDIFKDAGVAVFEAVTGAASSAIDWLSGNWPKILAVLTGPFGLLVYAIYTYWDEIIGFITGLPGRIASAASGMWDGIVGAFKSAINAVIGVWNNLRIPGFDITIHNPVPGAPNFSFEWSGIDLPNIPYLAQGGIAMKPTLAFVGEKGPEAIVPLGRGGLGGGNTYINVNVAPTADKAAVGLAIMEALTAAERKHGTRWRS